MRLTWFAIVTCRRPMLAGLVLALVLAFGSPTLTFAQEEQGAPQKPTVAFQNDAGLMILYVKADKTADFEELAARLKEGLTKIEAPEVKQQAESWKLFKGPVGNGTAVYVMLADPVVKNVEYWFLSLLYKAFPADAQALYQKWTDAKAANPPAVFDLTLVTKMQ
ncbi:MAG TPA: hypothetical protein PKK95_04055 [Vicinamibacterales bacterium]|nr:hypothetical protein [Vicinamibacterales bacterium]